MAENYLDNVRLSLTEMETYIREPFNNRELRRVGLCVLNDLLQKDLRKPSEIRDYLTKLQSAVQSAAATI